MKKLRNIALIIMMVAVIIAILLGKSNVSFAAPDETWQSSKATVYLGQYWQSGASAWMTYWNTYCLQHGQMLGDGMTHFVKQKVEIRGNTATFYDSSGNVRGVVNSSYNNLMAAMLTPNDYIPYSVLSTSLRSNYDWWSIGMYIDSSHATWPSGTLEDYSKTQLGLWFAIDTWANACASAGVPLGWDYWIPGDIYENGEAGGGVAFSEPLAQNGTFNVDLYYMESNYQNLLIVEPYQATAGRPIEKTSVTVKKNWSDSNNAYDTRPSSVEVTLKANGTAQDTVTLSDSNNWTYTFSDLLVYNSSGSKITYSVSETVPVGYKASYSGTTITNTLQTTSYKVTKSWNDGSNRDGKRPSSVDVTLYANGSAFKSATLSSSKSWTYTFSNLPQYIDGEKITYTVQEDTQIAGYSSSVNGGTITNSYTPERTEVNVTKVWYDLNNIENTRPSSVTVTLYKNGSSTGQKITLSESNNWTGTFTNLYKYEGGKEINYTVKETGVPSPYTSSVTENGTNDFTITNANVPKTQVTVKKEWDDDNNRDGKRPSSVIVALYQDGTATNKTVTLSSSNGWQKTFTDLLKYNEDGSLIEYTVEETSGLPDYDYVDVRENSTNNFTIINTRIPETINYTVDKIWDDDNNRDGIRPDSITVNLLANGRVQETVTLNDRNNWSYTFYDLYKYSGGKEISYTVDETNTPSGYSKSINGAIITNKHTPETRNIKVTKQWKGDDNNQDGVRPTSITVRLYENGADTGKTVTLNANNNWSNTFTGVYKYNKGKEINYTVKEEKVPDGYIGGESTGTMTNGFVITNTYMPGYIEIKGTVWVEKTRSKINDINGIQDDDESGLSGVKVTLKNSDGTNFTTDGKTYTTETNSSGEYVFKVNYDNNYGVYKLYETVQTVENKLKTAYIEFEYDGMKYTTVKTATSGINTSKAIENGERRSDLDDEYHEVNANSYKKSFNDLSWNDKKITASTKNVISFMNTYKGTKQKEWFAIQICKGNGKHIQSNDKDICDKPIEGTHSCQGCQNPMKEVEIRITSIGGVNLGLFEREQPDVAIFSDLKQVEVKMNGQKYTYLYDVRTNNNLAEDGQLDGLKAKFQNKKTYTYKRPVNPADIAYVNKKDNSAMKVWVTYDINVANLSNTLTTSIKEIANVYDSQYRLISVKRGTTGLWSQEREEAVNKEKTNNSYVTWQDTYEPNDKYKQIRIKLNNQLGIELECQKQTSAKKENNIEIVYEVELSKIPELLTNNAPLNIGVEILSYSTKYGTETLYAEAGFGKREGVYGGFDESIPGNANIQLRKKEGDNEIERLYSIDKTTDKILEPENVENDTDFAPAFVLVKDNKGTKTLSGTIWEDSNIMNNGEREGNGKFDRTENKIQNVKIELYNLKGEPAIRYNSDGDEITNDPIYPQPDGDYKIEGVVTGEYFIRYIYGDDTNSDGLTQKTSIINGPQVNARNYKSTVIKEQLIRDLMSKNYDIFSEEEKKWHLIHENDYSIAVDNMIDRLSIRELKNGNYNVGENMTAYTKPFKTQVEFDIENQKSVKAVDEVETGTTEVDGYIDNLSNEWDRMDFGIIERPRENLLVQKTITNLKITLANGQVLTQGNPSEPNANINYAKLMGFSQTIDTVEKAERALEKKVLVEIDQELMQGAKLEAEYVVTVKNNNEIDYEYGTAADYPELKPTVESGIYDQYITKNTLAKYYYFGDNEGLSEDDMIDAQIQFVDYLNRDLVHNKENNDKWTPIEDKQEIRDLHENGYIDEKVLEKLLDNEYEIHKSQYTIGRDDEPKEIHMKTSKLLANQDDNVFDNNAEIISIDGKTARTVKANGIEYVPGNYVPGKTEHKDSEVDDDKVEIIITPPTGATTYIIRYVLTALSGLIIVFAGVIFIKKKILTK